MLPTPHNQLVPVVATLQTFPSSPNINHIDVNTFDPYPKTNPNIHLKNLNKPNLIDIFYQTYQLKPFSAPEPFLVAPPPLGPPHHKALKRNPIWFAMKQHLLVICEIHMLEDTTNAHLVQENVPYYYFDGTIPAEYLVSVICPITWPISQSEN
ncbi:hypothetical protein VP01_510g15 [Puccinia sorghi]|uniref:Uncharacterized protein n=1 Tax=Puccinia sorghi TaxID=27349 RepID=A0A0L6UL69_9BASI|nr:hypothetical protein VP01_510g15 [Puccinia sorghi]